MSAQTDEKFVDLTLYDRKPRRIARPHPQPNELYIRSNRAIAPLLKRIKLLFFDGKVDTVHIHAAGKEIQTAVKIAVDFVNAHTPWFTTTTYTSTEIVIDEYHAKVFTAPNKSDEQPFQVLSHFLPPSTPFLQDLADTSSSPDGAPVKRKQQQADLDETSIDATPALATKKSSTAPPSDSSPSAGQEFVQLDPIAAETKDEGLKQFFTRERFVSAIHIVISKTPAGSSCVL